MVLLTCFEKCCCAFTLDALFADTMLLKYNSLLFIFGAVDRQKVKKGNSGKKMITVLDQEDFISLTAKLITALSWRCLSGKANNNKS